MVTEEQGAFGKPRRQLKGKNGKAAQNTSKERLVRPRISLVTPSFNQGDFLERTIESILSQRGDFDLEYLVVDGGSTDGSLEILRRYAGRLNYTSEPDQGQVDAINKGLRRATGDIVGWVNSDDLLRPGALALVVGTFQSNPGAEWVHGRCDIIDENDRIIRRWITAYKNWSCRRYSYSRLLTENFISQMTVFWKRSVIDEIGLLNPQFELAFDYDYWLSLARRSNPIFIDHPLACFRWYRTSKSGADFGRQFREEYAVARRHAAGRRWLLLLKRWRITRTVIAYRILRALR